MASTKLPVAESAPQPDSACDQNRGRLRVQLVVVCIVSLCVGGLIGHYGFPEAETPLLLRAPASRSQSSMLSPAAPRTAMPALATVTPVPLQVYVSGAVNQPQVVRVAPGSLVRDALAAVGGVRDDADLDSVNLAAPLTDHQHIIVPQRAETAGASTTGSAGAAININTATAAELESLPGIGPSRAADIIAYRETHGSFSRPEDIQNVTGIGAGLYQEIAPFITVGP